MEFRRAFLEDCSQAQGTVVVIDVLRAFSTAAYAFGAGASHIIPVSTIEQAFELKERFPNALVMGEDYGVRVEGFDLTNSPSEIAAAELNGRALIQRTTAGTQGIILSRNASVLLATGFCTAGATARYIRQVQPATLTLVITGSHTPDHGDEDAACADYVEALLSGTAPNPRPYLERVRRSEAGRKFLDPGVPEFSAADLNLCARANIFDFAMVVDRTNGHPIIRAVNPI